MKTATRDRGDIIHFAGRHGLSPALREGLPTFVTGPDPSARRCGWETFFRAMGDRRLALLYDPEDAASVELRPEADVADVPRPHGSLGSALDHARRFWRALFPPRSAPGGGAT
jgi:hypothetical protein